MLPVCCPVLASHACYGWACTSFHTVFSAWAVTSGNTCCLLLDNPVSSKHKTGTQTKNKINIENSFFS
jgi:hypothetical protein